MEITHFSKEDFLTPEELDLEQKIIRSEQAIPHESVKRYANFVISELSKIAPKDEQAFIVDVLSDDWILTNFEALQVGERSSDDFADQVTVEVPEAMAKLAEQDEQEKNSIIERIRKALCDELSGKIDGKMYLFIKNLYYNENRNKKIDLAVDVTNKNKAINKDNEGSTSNEPEVLAEALAILMQHPPHENIRKVIGFDANKREVLYAAEEFVTMESFVKGKKTGKEVLESLSFILDAIKGAKYLAEMGLVLQDICLPNIGIKEDATGKKIGFLPDLEGLVKAGSLVGARIFQRDYYVPGQTGARGQEKISNPCEMVWQFGRCITEIIEVEYVAVQKSPEHSVINKIIVDLRNLFLDMRKEYYEVKSISVEDSSAGSIDSLDGEMAKPNFMKRQNRISLAEAETRLGAIITRINYFYKIMRPSSV